MASVNLSRALTSADAGSHTWTLSFAQSGRVASAQLSVTINAAPPAFAVTLSPTSVTLPANAAAGTLLTTPTFTGSDGTPITMTAVDEHGNPAPVSFTP